MTAAMEDVPGRPAAPCAVGNRNQSNNTGDGAATKRGGHGRGPPALVRAAPRASPRALDRRRATMLPCPLPWNTGGDGFVATPEAEPVGLDFDVASRRLSKPRDHALRKVRAPTARRAHRRVSV